MPYCWLIVTVLIAFIGTGPAFGQRPAPTKKNKNIGVFNITQLGSNSGIGNANYRPDVQVKNNGNLSRLRTTFGYFVKPEFSVGLGFGLEAYDKPQIGPRPLLNNQLALAPLVTDFRYYRRPADNSLFAVANVGYSLPFGEPFESGAVAGLGVGYRLIVARKAHLLASVGLETHQIRDARILVPVSPGAVEEVRSNIWLKSVSFNVGILF